MSIEKCLGNSMHLYHGVLFTTTYTYLKCQHWLGY